MIALSYIIEIDLSLIVTGDFSFNLIKKQHEHSAKVLILFAFQNNTIWICNDYRIFYNKITEHLKNRLKMN